MKNKLWFIALLICLDTFAQVKGSLEHIYYFEPTGNFSMGPIGKLYLPKHWYAEARYNYEERKTFSLYTGRAYSHQGIFSYTVVPIFGGVIGRFKGGSVGLNIDLDYKGFFLSSQSQYTFSSNNENKDFFFSWTEAGYQPLKWLYTGLSMQPTYYPQTKQKEWSPGAVVGFCFRSWTVPVYVFNPLTDNTTFVVAIVKEWGNKK
jgi:hypothetical protein